MSLSSTNFSNRQNDTLTLKRKVRHAAKADASIIAELKKKSEEFQNKVPLRSLVRTKDPELTAKYFFLDIIKFAKEVYKPNNAYSLLDLITETFLKLVEELEKDFPIYQRLRGSVETISKKAINDFVLKNKAHELNIEYSPKGFHQLEDTPILDLEDRIDSTVAWQDISKRIDSFTGVEASRLKRFFALDGQPKPLSSVEIAKEDRVTKAAISLSIARSIAKLKADSTLTNSLDLLREISARPLRPSLTELQTPAINKDLESIKRNIETSLGSDIEEFRKLHGLSRKEFIKFIQDTYPIDCKISKRVISLSDDEIRELDLHCITAQRRIYRAKSPQELFDGGQEIKLSRQDLLLRLRELYFPMFINDKTKCIGLLKNDIEKARTIQERELFQEIFDFYSRQVQELKVRRLKSALDDYQKVNALIMAPKNSYMIAHDMGVGKSIEAMAFALMKKCKKILIISSKSGASVTWPKELKKHLKGKPRIYSSLDIKSNNLNFKQAGPNWVVVGYSFARKNASLLRRLGFDLVILDECHRANNDQSEQSKAVLSLDSPYKIAMSGSLFKNSREELFPVLHWLYPKEFPNKYNYNERYCYAESGIYKLRYDLQDKMTCRLKHQVLNLPPVNDKRISIVMSAQETKNYQKFEDEFIEWCKKEKKSLIGGSISQALFLKLHKLRQEAIKAKIGTACNLAKRTTKEGHKVVIYTTYLDYAKQLAVKLNKLNPCYLDGGSSPEARRQQIETFENNPENKVFIVTTAGGDSIDLTAADTIIFLNKPFTYADEKQMLDRLDRRGQKKSVTAIHLSAAGTIDEKIDNLIQRKKEEYEKIIRDPEEFANWFIENQDDNIKELIQSIITQE